jgi:peptidoglycan hydrolase-like protein with peptidoglycan-binding domain
MIRVQFRDQGPRVVLIQIALSTRPPQSRLRIDGDFGIRTQTAVKLLQASLRRPQTGIVEGPEWKAMMSSMPFQTFDHTDVDDAITALQAGNFDQNLREGHQYGIVALAELQRAEAPAASIGVGASNGVGQMVARAIQAGQSTKLGLLRVFGHGGRGIQVISAGRGAIPGGSGEHQSALTPTVVRHMRAEMRRMAVAFQPYGSAELHGCRVADGDPGRLLLKDLAEAWGVPVTAGIQKQHVGSGQTFRFEGRTLTAYPGRVSLLQWAQRVASQSAFSRA